MKKIFITMVAVLAMMITCVSKVEASSRYYFDTYTEVPVEEVTDIYAGEIYIIESGYNDFEQYYDYNDQLVLTIENTAYVNSVVFTDENVDSILENEFDATASKEFKDFITNHEKINSAKVYIKILFMAFDDFMTEDIKFIMGCDVRAAYKVTPLLTSSTETHVVNYDNNITLDQIKSTYRAVDNYDGDISDQIKFTSNYPANPKDAKVNTQYYITASVTDSNGNQASLTNLIIVKDITKPKFSNDTLSFNYDYGVNVTIDDLLNKITCTDNYDGNIDKSLWQIDGELNLKNLEVQTITVSYKDTSGNVGTCVITVKITDEAAPIIAVSPIDITTTSPLTEEQILQLLVSVNEIDSNFVDYTLVSEYFNSPEEAGKYLATLSVYYEDGSRLDYRFNINVVSPTINNNTNNNLGLYIGIGAAILVLIGGLVTIIVIRKKKYQN